MFNDCMDTKYLIKLCLKFIDMLHGMHSIMFTDCMSTFDIIN